MASGSASHERAPSGAGFQPGTESDQSFPKRRLALRVFRLEFPKRNLALWHMVGEISAIWR